MSGQPFPPDLPPALQDVYRRFLPERPLTRELLIARVRSYLDTLCRADNRQDNLDVATSSDLGRGLLRLLRECPEEGLPHAQAAVSYFVKSDDADPDLGSLHGFDDDAVVFNCVCRHLQLPQLQVATPDHAAPPSAEP